MDAPPIIVALKMDDRIDLRLVIMAALLFSTCLDMNVAVDEEVVPCWHNIIVEGAGVNASQQVVDRTRAEDTANVKVFMVWPRYIIDVQLWSGLLPPRSLYLQYLQLYMLPLLSLLTRERVVIDREEESSSCRISTYRMSWLINYLPVAMGHFTS